MGKLYYVTAATGEDFIHTYTRCSVLSLLKVGIKAIDIHVVGRRQRDIELFKKYFPEVNMNIVEEDLSRVKWKIAKGKRKFSLFKAAALYKTFPQPVDGRCMVYFDGDVLWFKNPTEFLENKSDRTWFHHGKNRQERSEAGKKGLTSKDIDVTNYKSLSKWVAAPQAHLMVKWGATIVPEREVVAGFYILHPSDHAKVLETTYKGCIENANKFQNHEGAGDQKPMNAAIAIHNIDWHGGLRFDCPEYVEYFEHYWGGKAGKKAFRDKAKELGVA